MIRTTLTTKFLLNMNTNHKEAWIEEGKWEEGAKG